MALGYDYNELIASVNTLSQTVQEIADRREEKRRYEEEKKMAQEQFEYEKSNAERNYELQQQAFKYQQQLNAQTQLREDTAVRRKIADLQSAGFSGLGAVSGGASAGALTSLQAPQLDSAGMRESNNQRISVRQNALQRRLEYGLKMRQLNLESTNQVLQGIKLNNEIKTERIRRNQLEAQTALLGEQKISSEKEREWMQKEGYRGESVQQALISAIHAYLDNRSNKSGMFDQALDISENSVKQGLSSLSVSAQEQINKLPEPQKKAVCTYIGAVVGSAYVRLKNTPAVQFGRYIYQNMFHKSFNEEEEED